ncbi:MAG: exonuclease SbcCD subunit D C-terminal domain-containing protein, partial [Clostridia bacterium]|nr:exonuclease SbcCD subunit D C-terminal domain-containing protein [Clostridia bacterium]
QQVYIIAGNHDSAERLAFGGQLMAGSGIHIAPAYRGEVSPFVLHDEFGEVRLYLLPFVKPTHVRAAFPEKSVESYTDGVRAAVEAMGVDPSVRNLLVTHQFVTGAALSDSEELAVGGSDNVDAEVFAPFDYVALGHIHGPQRVGGEHIRYSGTPLKYSVSEARHKKSVTAVTLGPKGEVTLELLPLTPLRDVVELRGSYEELTARDFYRNTGYQEDYVSLTLTDEEEIPDAIGKLRAIYHHILKLSYDNRRTRETGKIEGAYGVEEKSPLTLFAELYALQNNQELTPVQEEFLGHTMEEIWGKSE